MKIIKITKSFRSGTVIGYIVSYDDAASKEYIEDMVEEWCEDDLAGHSNGYEYEWEYVTDENLIIKIIEDKIKYCDIKIEKIKNELLLLDSYLKK